ncbi:hypothetical protein ACQ4PT_051331 [Festuca glaucescens]
MANFSSLSVFQLSYNDLHGWVPPVIFQHKRLVTIDLHQIPGVSGTLPNFSADSNLENLLIGNTNFSGAIPSSVGNLKSLKKLGLGAQGFAGDLPSSIGELRFLSSLEVSGLETQMHLKGNQLQGVLPHDINKHCMLEAIDFSDNWIQGLLPRSLASCKNLEVLDIGNNHINDSFPCWMSALPSLQVLVLNNNKFFGQVAPIVAEDKGTCEFQSLRVLDLASNNFSGALAGDFIMKLKSMMVNTANGALAMEYKADLQRLQQKYQVATSLTYKGNSITFEKIVRTLVLIDVSNNVFHGSIPEAIGKLVLLNTLNMSHNLLTQPIPSEVDRLKQLESLDLSSNALTGVIPQGLATLDFLATLNLSDNNLEGRIPESPHFLTFSNNSFVRNDGLCGPPLSQKCSNAPTSNTACYPSKDKPADITLFLFAGLGFSVGFAIVIVMTWVLPLRKKS